MARYPDYQVELLEPTPNTPTSLGLVKFQQASLKRNSVYPVSLSRGLAYSPGTNSGGKRPANDPILPYLFRSLSRDPNKILSPWAEVGVIIRAKAFSLGNPPKREKAMERKGRDVLDVRTPACM